MRILKDEIRGDRIVCDDLYEFKEITDRYQELLKDGKYIYGVDTTKYEWIIVTQPIKNYKMNEYILKQILGNTAYNHIEFMFMHYHKWYCLDHYGRVVKLDGVVITNAEYRYDWIVQDGSNKHVDLIAGICHYLPGFKLFSEKCKPELSRRVQVVLKDGTKMKCMLRYDKRDNVEYFITTNGYVIPKCDAKLWIYLDKENKK